MPSIGQEPIVFLVIISIEMIVQIRIIVTIVPQPTKEHCANLFVITENRSSRFGFSRDSFIVAQSMNLSRSCLFVFLFNSWIMMSKTPDGSCCGTTIARYSALVKYTRMSSWSWKLTIGWSAIESRGLSYVQLDARDSL